MTADTGVQRQNGFFQEGGRDCSKQALKRGETGVNEKETVQL